MSDTKPKKTGPANGPKKVFDISRPGKVPASATSRPIITSHKAPNADDQFVAKKDDHDTENDRHALKHKDLGLKPETAPVPASPAPAESDSSRSPEATPDTAPVVAATSTMPSVEPAAPETQEDPLLADVPDVHFDSEEEKTAPELDTYTAPEPEATPPSESAEPEFDATAPPTEADSEMLRQDQPTDASEPSPAHETEPQPERPMSHEDVLAATSAPLLEQVIVSHHKAHRTKLWEWLLIFILMLVVAAAALNFLLDAEVLKIDMDIPHTDWLK